LVCMHDILRKRLNDRDPVLRQTYKLLYEPFLHPLSRCTNLIFPNNESTE
jgi:hypothetical protein